MPLNIKENREESFQEKPKPEPILHTPSETNHLVSRIMWILFGVVVFVAIGFLLYTYGVFGTHRETTSSVVVSAPSQQPPQVIAQSPATVSPLDSARKNPSVVSSPGGRFTDYIGAYIVRSDAEEEVARWKEAGFEAFVRESGSWYRVAFGRYDHVPDARHRATEYEESFEQGYWIGPI